MFGAADCVDVPIEVQLPFGGGTDLDSRELFGRVAFVVVATRASGCTLEHTSPKPFPTPPDSLPTVERRQPVGLLVNGLQRITCVDVVLVSSVRVVVVGHSDLDQSLHAFAGVWLNWMKYLARHSCCCRQTHNHCLSDILNCAK